MKFNLSPDDVEDHHEEVNSCIKEIYALRLGEKYSQASLGIACMKISSLMAARADIGQENHEKLNGQYYDLLKIALDSEKEK